MKPRKYNDKKVSDEGVILTKTTVAKWPHLEFPFTIEVVNEIGECVESVSINGAGADSARWNEIRDMMPDDALYFQPEKAGEKKANTTARNIQSFNVYRHFENAKKAHGDCIIRAFSECHIRQPVFLDEQNPTFYWNNVD
jgi:hypothetical protein